ncbi:MAG: TetR/AcrR family transcriptional regulator [Myxococcota bacterium]
MPKKKGKSRTPLQRDAILTAAIRLADAQGIEALSMRRLGREVGVEAMSLYNHVANKDDVLDGIVDLIVGEIEVPSLREDWKAAMRRRGLSAHEVLMRHPWATKLMVSRVNVGPNMLRYVNATIGSLREAGFSWAMADHAWNVIDSFVYGFTLQRLNFPFDADEYANVAASYLPSISAEEFPYLRGMTREVAEGRHDGLQDFAFGLDLVLDGLARLRSTEPAEAKPVDV